MRFKNHHQCTERAESRISLTFAFLLVASVNAICVQASANSESDPIAIGGAVSCSRLELNTDFDPDDYTIFQGDLNGDGDDRDYLMYRKDQFILIHGDILIPIYIRGPSSIKFTRKDGAYSFNHAEAYCNGAIEPEYSEDSIQQLLLSGDLREVSPSNVSVADFNLDGRGDVVLNADEEALVFHWDAGTPRLVSTLQVVQNSDLIIQDVNNDGVPDIQVFHDGKFVRLYLADSNGIFTSNQADASDQAGASPDTDDESKIATIQQTWKLFSEAMVAGDYDAGSLYLTSNYKTQIDDLIVTLGDEVGEVLEQVKSIAPYYVGEKSSTFLIYKVGDDGMHYVHSVTFESSEDGSWKIAEM